MRIAVTGASGFVGGRIARALAAAGHAVTSYGRRPTRMLSTPLPDYQVWDVSEHDAPRIAVDAVVHCAALVGDWGGEREYNCVNVAGTAAVLEAFAAARRFVHVSTTSVYSDGQPKVQLREDTRTGDCLTWYGRTKAAAESLVMQRRADAVILRPHMVYGPGDTTLLPRVVAAARFGQLAIPGNGANLVSPTHVDNLVDAVTCALATAARGAFNVADESPAPIGELLTRSSRALARQSPCGTFHVRSLGASRQFSKARGRHGGRREDPY